MTHLKVGFARTTINPMNGIGLSGYFITRLCEGVHDDIEANIVTFSDDIKTAVMIVLDLCEIETKTGDRIREAVANELGISEEAVFVSATHTHTGPYIGIAMEGAPQDLTDQYTECLIQNLVENSRKAYENRKNAKIGYAIGEVKGIAFSRRFLMKDGNIATNPGLHNPDIVTTIGEPDTALPIVRIDREDGDTVVIANYGCHPDTVGGNFVSADWPGVFRREFERNVPNTKAVFLNGAEGEINHINVQASEDELHGMHIDFDDIPRGYQHTLFMGKAVADVVREIYPKVTYTTQENISYFVKSIDIPTNRATSDELIEAHRIHELHILDRDHELPYEGMFLTTVVAEAERMCDLENGPDSIPTYMAALSIGSIAFIGIAGEPFSEIGRELKKADDWDIVIPCALTDGWTGYFPNRTAYEEGGYEPKSSPFAPGVAELLVDEGRNLLKQMRMKDLMKV